MSAHVDTLFECLKEKERLMEKLILLLDEERDYIVAMDTAGMDIARSNKMELIGQLERSKAACQNTMLNVANDLQLDTTVNLATILNALPASRREALAIVQRSIVELNDVLNRSNRFNRDLLYGSLAMINRSIAFFNSCFGKESTYGIGGQIVSGITGGRLVSGAI